MINLLHKNNRILVTGRTGSGKSSFIEYHLTKEAKQDIVFICDVKDEWCHRLGIQKTTDFNSIKGDEKYVCFNPLDFPDRDSAFEDFCLYVYTFSDAGTKIVLAVFEELQTFVNHHCLPSEFLDVLVRGRKHQLDMVMASTQPNLIHNAIRSALSEVVVFGQSDELATKHSRSLGIDGVENLVDLQFYRKRVGHPPLLHTISFSKKGIDISRGSDSQ